MPDFPPEFVTWIEKVRSDFPQVAPFLDKPGVAEVILRAANEQWGSGQLTAALAQTDYWKTTTESQRRWDATVATDPATAQRQFMMTAQLVQNMRQRLGVTISEDAFTRIASDATRGNWSDDTLRTALVGAWRAGGYQTTAGDLGASITNMRKMANDYGVTLADETLFDYARRMAEGSMDENGATEYMRQQATSRYSRNPALVDALQRGISTRQFANPYLQVAAKELNMPPDNMALNDPKWSRFLDESLTSGQQGLSLDEWRRVVRTDHQYGWDQTANARDEAAALTTRLAQKFGGM